MRRAMPQTEGAVVVVNGKPMAPVTPQERLRAHVNTLVRAVLALCEQGRPEEFWGRLEVNVQGGGVTHINVTRSVRV